MGNIIDYVKTEMRTFAQKPFTEVDSLVLSQFSYFNMRGLVPDVYDDEPSVSIRDLFRAESFDQLSNKTFIPESNLALLTAMVASPRFRNTKLNYFVNEIDSEVEMQFSAVTFFTDDDSVYIAFRGTDGTLIGWKEDFNMAFTYPLPAQEAGLIYMNAVSGFVPPSIGVRTGGHSKGGNISVHASMKCHPTFRNRITDIFNHDGPGFNLEVLESVEFQKIEDRIRKTLPQASIFGMLLHQNENYSVIESTGFSGFVQHIPFNWVVEEGNFRYLEKLKSGSFHTQDTINDWLFALSAEERKHFVDTIFQLVEATDAHKLTDLTDDWLKATLKFLAAAKDLDPDTKKFVQNAISTFFKASIKGLSPRPVKSAPGLPADAKEDSSK
jgi:hypothetical protein